MIIPYEWEAILSKLRTNGFPEAIIAGGAIRDLDHDKPVKDVDIFIRKPENLDGLSLKGLVEEALGRNVDNTVVDFQIGEEMADDANETYDLHEMSVYAIYRLFTLETTFEIIVMQYSEAPFVSSVIDDFDIGFCQAWYPSETPGLPFDVTVAYADDFYGKSLTVLKAPTPRALERTMKRVRRLLEKYPDFTVRFAHDIEHLVDPKEVPFD